MLASPFVRHYVAGVDASWDIVDLLRASPTGLVLPITGMFRERARRDVEAALVEARASELDAVTQELTMRALAEDAYTGPRRTQLGSRGGASGAPLVMHAPACPT